MSLLENVSLETAEECCNNWMRWKSFYVQDRETHEGRFIFYTTSRDSGLSELSNAKSIEALLDPFTIMPGMDDMEPDVISFGASHWAVGYVDGYSVRVFKQGTKEPTEAFLKLIEIAIQLADYHLLDEEDYCRREYQATLENIENEGASLLDGNLSEGWVRQVFSWLWNNNQGAVENVDDQGGSPSREDIREALEELKLIKPEIDEDDYTVGSLP